MNIEKEDFKERYEYTFSDKIGFVGLIDRMVQEHPLKVVNSARLSYSNNKEEFDHKDQRLTKYLWDHEHTSPFRHSYYTFHCKSPLFVFRQWIKYQVGCTWRGYNVNNSSTSLEVFDFFFDLDKGCSWNEISARYTELKPEFYIPEKFRTNSGHASKQGSEDIQWTDKQHLDMAKVFSERSERAYQEYLEYIDTGIAREMARIMLPQNIYTQAYWTVSLQAILHFLSQRLKADAQFEIRHYAETIYSLIEEDLSLLGISKEQLI